MAIGTWKEQDKIRPGVYINYVFSESELINYASEGIMAMPYQLPLMPSDPSMLEITSQEVRAKTLEKYGIVQGNNSYKFITTLLKYCSKILLYPVGEGGAKAVLTTTGFKATAIGAGVEGNKIAVEVLAKDTDTQTFNTYYNDEIVAIQSYDWNTQEWTGTNDYVEIEITGSSVDAAVPTLLAGGSDGTVDAKSAIKNTTEALAKFEVEVIVFPFAQDEYEMSAVKDFINNYNECHVQKIIVVVPCTDNSDLPNSEYIIATANQTATLENGLVMDNKMLACYIGAKEAGATYLDDLTFNFCEDIVDIDELTNDEVETNIKRGIMNLSLRSDRSVIIEDDINSLVLLSTNQSSALKANDTLRLLNDLSYRIVSFGENVVIGKKKVTETTLNVVKAFIISIMNQYATEQVIVNFDAANDVQVVFGEQPDGILCTIAIQKTQSAKKLYFSIGVR